MSRQIGDIYEAMTYKEVAGQTVECTGEFEVTSIDTQTKEDGLIVTIENSKLLRYLD